jgi:membrane dipeptidase
MINFFPAFVVPESARVMREMFEVGRRLRKEFPKEEDYKAAIDRWKTEHPFARGSVKTVADHIDHIKKVIGVEYIGIGSDFDGISSTPLHLEHVGDYPNLTQELLNRGYTPAEIKRILGENLLRVMRKVEAVGKSLANVPPRTNE